MLAADDFFDRRGFDHAELFAGCERVWEVLQRLPEYLAAHARRELGGEVAPGAVVEGEVWLAPDAVIEPGARVVGPAIIGRGCRVGHGTLLRDGVIMGAGAAVGHGTEVKASILLPDARASHLNYVGDSILGRGVNLGAGAVCSNFKVTRTAIVLTVAGAHYDTGLTKLGAIVGDGSQIGCNSVLNPGTLLGKNVLTYPCTSLRGFFPAGTIVKLSQRLGRTERR
jgi:NDP-sugar pyrophosphorylase family protein